MSATEPILEILDTTKVFLEDDGTTLEGLRVSIESMPRMVCALAYAMPSVSKCDWFSNDLNVVNAVRLFEYGVGQQIIAYPHIVNPYDRIVMNRVRDEIAKMALYYANPAKPEARYTKAVEIPGHMTDVRLLLFFTFLDDQMMCRSQSGV